MPFELLSSATEEPMKLEILESCVPDIARPIREFESINAIKELLHWALLHYLRV